MRGNGGPSPCDSAVPSHGRERQRDQGRQPAATPGEHSTGANVGERDAPVKQNPLPSQ